MERALDPDLLAAFQQGRLRPFVAAMLTFRSKAEYCWSGVGTLSFGGNDYRGVGIWGRVGTVTEGVQVRADGTTVGLTAIDPDIYHECMADIQQGLPAKLYAGALTDAGDIYGIPFCYFSGYVDSSNFELSPETMTITLNLENLMADLQRPVMLRYTRADQALLHPTCSAFDSVEILNDQPLRWGT